MPIADWEQTINNAFAAQGLNPYFTADQASSPWESGGTAGLQAVVDGTYGKGQLPGGGIGGAPVSSGGIPDMGRYGGSMAASSFSGGSNPYLQQQGDALRQQSDFALGQNLNSLRSNSVGVGGLGGSRQGVAQGVATGLANQGYTGALANIGSQDWNNQQNRNLQRYGVDSQAALGWGGLDNQRYGMDQNFYTQQRGQDQSGAALGANLVNVGTQGGWTPIQNANNVYGNYTGFGNTTQSGSSGGGLSGALGGALGGAQLWNSWGSPSKSPWAY